MEKKASRRSPGANGLPNLTPISQDTTPTLIARLLRNAIAEGQFTPGQHMLETSLAQSLGVSRGPLREAMQRLTQEGLLVSRRNRGLFVVDLDEAAIRDIFLARTAIERAAVAHIIETGGGERGAELLKIAKRMAANKSEPSGPKMSQIDMEFHETLVELAHSPQLRRMHRTLLTQLRMLLTIMQPTYTSADERALEHSRIAEAIVDEDAALADRLLVEHMNDGLSRILTGTRRETHT